MQKNEKGYEVISVEAFARMCGYYFSDIGFHKKHGQFLNEFQEEGWILKILAEFYLERRGEGVLLTPTYAWSPKPTTCCRSGSNEICRSSARENKLLETITRLEALRHPVPEAVIWHDLFLQMDNCFLKNEIEYMYLLFHLRDTGKLIKVVGADNSASYSVSLVPVKRGPGRPRKYL